VRGGQPHDLVAAGEATGDDRAVRYRCRRCSEGYQVRTSAPSCRIDFLEQLEQLLAPYASMEAAARRAVLEELVRRRFTWPRPVREVMLDRFERWQAWKAGHHRDRPGGR
jgi:hypothetical protein